MSRRSRFVTAVSTAALFVGLAFTPAAFAADAMSHGDGMSAGQMKKPDDKMGMGHDSMSKDGMAKDCAMKKDGMAKDGMSKDCDDMSDKGMSHDGMSHDGMAKKSN